MSTDQAAPYSKRYLTYALYLLTGVYAINFIDRQILVILQESIKNELDLSDTQLGLLTGPAFAFFYVALGLPIARLADRSNRKNIIAASLAIWSGFTALSGLIQNYTQLFLARMGVGIGEAGCSPPAHALISDYFEPKRRATALAIYSSGIYIGVLIGFLVAGWLDQIYGWRVAFFCVGLPGIAYAFLVYLTLKEPIRGLSEKVRSTIEKQASLRAVMNLLFSKKSFLWLALGTGFNTFVLYGTGNWFPSFLARMHEMSPGEIGTWSALIAGAGGAIGTYLGGKLTDRYGTKDVRWYYWLPCIAMAFSFPFYMLFSFTDNTSTALISLVFPYLLMTFYLAPSIAMTHGMVQVNMRAFASSVLFLILNLIGLGLGPVFVGMLSDYLEPNLGQESIRWAIMACSLFIIPSILCYLKAAQHLQDDLI